MAVSRGEQYVIWKSLERGLKHDLANANLKLSIMYNDMALCGFPRKEADAFLREHFMKLIDEITQDDRSDKGIRPFLKSEEEYKKDKGRKKK